MRLDWRRSGGESRLLRRSNNSGEVTAARDSSPFNEVLLGTGVVRRAQKAAIKGAPLGSEGRGFQ